MNAMERVPDGCRGGLVVASDVHHTDILDDVSRSLSGRFREIADDLNAYLSTRVRGAPAGSLAIGVQNLEALVIAATQFLDRRTASVPPASALLRGIDLIVDAYDDEATLMRITNLTQAHLWESAVFPAVVRAARTAGLSDVSECAIVAHARLSQFFDESFHGMLALYRAEVAQRGSRARRPIDVVNLVLSGADRREVLGYPLGVMSRDVVSATRP
tara:strand:+ start:401 stop:1048 length:648 start_codon:yes stop_codon:yes gene_type:complete